MAQALLTRHLADRGLAGRVRSAGVVPGSAPASDEAVEVMAERGLDVSGHKSRRLDTSMIDEAELILGMSRTHVREVVVLDNDAFERTFTLKELVRRGVGVGPRRPEEALDEWLRRVGAGRERSDLLGSSTHDDIADPLRQRVGVFETTAAEIDGLLGRLLSLIHPPR
jgi:protein-tyrosine phosphatase